MHIKSVEFAGAIASARQAPPVAIAGLPQVAFAGRSNVGKSSLINRLLGRTRTQIARVSQQPGKTQEINFYHVRSDVGDFCLVDLPGYGYARVPHAVRERFAPLIQGFLRDSPALAGVVQLIDLRHSPTPEDRASLEFLAEVGVPVLIALTKADKLSATRREKAVASASRALGIELDQVVPFSSLSGLGREELLETIGGLVAAARDAGPASTGGEAEEPAADATQEESEPQGRSADGEPDGGPGASPRSGPAAGALLALLLAGASGASGCVAATPGDPGVPAPSETRAAAAVGSLREEEISVELARDGVRLRVTPLSETVLRLTAPDTRNRLQALAARATAHGRDVSEPFLVSFVAARPGQGFEPGSVEVETVGRRLRPQVVIGLTPGWADQRLEPHRPQTALVRFDGEVDLTSAWVLRYDGGSSSGWSAVLARLEAEAARTGSPLRGISRPDRSP
jgi:GTP-binding protein